LRFADLPAGAQLMLIAIGQPRAAAIVAALRAIVLIPLVVAGLALGDAMGAVVAMFTMAAMMFAVNLAVVARTVRVSRRELLEASWRPIVATLVMVATVLALVPLLPGGASLSAAIVRLAVESLAGLASYVLALWSLWSLVGRPPGAEAHALNFARPALGWLGVHSAARR
jgi:hypothetical protein